MGTVTEQMIFHRVKYPSPRYLLFETVILHCIKLEQTYMCVVNVSGYNVIRIGYITSPLRVSVIIHFQVDA